MPKHPTLAVLALASLVALGISVALSRHPSFPSAPSQAPEFPLDAPSRSSIPLRPEPAEASRTTPELRSPLPVVPGGATTEAHRPPTPSGTLRVRVVDASTGAGLPDHPLRVYTERPRFTVLETGSTDEGGEFRIQGLAENIYAVTTERKPPHAAATNIAWLSEGESAELVVEVGRGQVLEGRVVDFGGAPLPGAEILLQGQGHGIPFDQTFHRRPIIARSDERGRFRIEAVAPTPTGLWWVDGAMRPEGWLPIGVRAEYFRSRTEHRIDDIAVHGPTLPDLALPIPATVSGTVVDDRGDPVPGVLVSSRRSKHLGPAWGERDARTGIRWSSFPGESDFAWTPPTECITDRHGVFEVQTALRPTLSFRVRTASGWEQGVEIPRDPDGPRVEGVTVRIEPHTTLAVLHRDDSGAPIDLGSIPRFDDGMGRSMGRSNRVHGLSIQALTFDGKQLRGPLRLSPGNSHGLLLTVPCPPASIAAIDVRIPGYRRMHRALSDAERRDRSVTVHLDPWGEIRLDLHPQEGALLDTRPVRLTVGICLDRGGGWSGEFRASRTVYLGPGGTSLELIAQVPGAYRLRVYPFNRGEQRRDFGTRVPSKGRYRIELDRSFFESIAAPEKPAYAPWPPVPVHARIVDAVTGKELEEARWVLPDGSWGPWGCDPTLVLVDSDGFTWVDPNRVADIEWCAVCRGYRPSAPLPVRLEAGVPVDLGTVALEPAAKHRLRILDRDGRQLDSVGVDLHSPELDGPMALGRGKDGLLVVYDLDESPALLSLRSSDRGHQYLRMDPWPVDVIQEIRFAPPPRSELRVDVRSDRIGFLDAGLSVRLVRLDPPEGFHLNPKLSVREIPRGPGGDRRFATELPPGRYSLGLWGLGTSLPEVELTIEPNDPMRIVEFGLP